MVDTGICSLDLLSLIIKSNLIFISFGSVGPSSVLKLLECFCTNVTSY